MRLLVASLVLVVAGGLAGCSGDGGDGGSGGDAPTVAAFCAALMDFQTAVDATDPTNDLPGYISTLKDGAETLDGVGTPEEIPDEARAGFDLTIAKITALSEDATQEDLSQIGEVDDEDQVRLDALSDYIADACPDLAGDTGLD